MATFNEVTQISMTWMVSENVSTMKSSSVIHMMLVDDCPSTVYNTKIAHTVGFSMFVGDYTMNSKIIAIGMLLAVVGFVIGRLPAIEGINHLKPQETSCHELSPLGLTYAFLYMGRYN